MSGFLAATVAIAALTLTTGTVSATELDVRVTRLLDRPIITPDLHPSIGQNIQGPSLIRVPEWIEDRLGDYYLYFADHKGRYIRLAYADHITGPWSIHAPGSLQIEDSHFPTERPEVPPGLLAELKARWTGLKMPERLRIDENIVEEIATTHIASPDVHVDDTRHEIVMYFHGLEDVATQVTRVATSTNGIDFTAQPQVLGQSYMRVFRHDGMTYALAMPGQLYRSGDGFDGFEPRSGGAGPSGLVGSLFGRDMRHSALWMRDDTLWVFWTRVGDAPERILASRIDLAGDWREWRESAAIEVLRPERDWEGADAPLVPSARGAVYEHVNQLRDPAIFEEDGRVFLLYAVAGESGIAIAEVLIDER